MPGAWMIRRWKRKPTATSLVGRCRQPSSVAAQAAFPEFLSDRSLTSSEVRFIETIIDQLTSGGVMDARALYGPPFSHLHAGGPDALFAGKKTSLIGSLGRWRQSSLRSKKQDNKSTTDMDWINPNIAVGNFHDARNATKEELDAVLCLATDCCSEDNDELNILCVPLVDGAGNEQRFIEDAIDFIHDIVSNGERILVHCHAGRSRSVCMVARYFMIKQGNTSHQALARISAKRNIFLSPGIEELLKI
ncbi:dual specificity protein phosphatase family protein [Halomonas tibetensis]|uniref:Dual specificity protein phosphatase family protein n=1 Tax=Halomonas tibetensis TaxID=2259590 RepID=A0ABV7B917_9GAMM